MRGILTLGVVFVMVMATETTTAAEYKLDPAHSFALFNVKHFGASLVYGQFTAVEGTVQFDPDNPDGNAVEVTIKTDSLTTHNERRDRHLHGPDFFNVKEFPVMTFKSESWKKTGEDMYEVAGDLTILGQSKPVTVEVRHVGSGKNPQGVELAGFHSTFVIDRSDFGMNYGIAEDGSGLGKNVEVIISVEGDKQ